MTIRNDVPLSEQFRLAALEHVDLDGAARMLEESKSSVLATWKTELGDISDAKAERIVKSSDRWKDFIRKTVNARTRAEQAKVNVKYIDMLAWEQRSADANARAERKL